MQLTLKYQVNYEGQRAGWGFNKNAVNIKNSFY